MNLAHSRDSFIHSFIPRPAHWVTKSRVPSRAWTRAVGTTPVQMLSKPRELVLKCQYFAQKAWNALVRPGGSGWWAPEPVGCSWPICLGLLRARSPCTGKEVSDAASHATEREKRGGQLVIAVGYKSPKARLSSGSESRWPRFVSERRHYF